MRTTIVLDDALVHEAREALGSRTIKDTVERALRETVRMHRTQRLLSLIGTLELDLTPEELHEWRRGHDPLPD